MFPTKSVVLRGPAPWFECFRTRGTQASWRGMVTWSGCVKPGVETPAVAASAPRGPLASMKVLAGESESFENSHQFVRRRDARPTFEPGRQECIRKRSRSTGRDLVSVGISNQTPSLLVYWTVTSVSTVSAFINAMDAFRTCRIPVDRAKAQRRHAPRLSAEATSPSEPPVS